MSLFADRVLADVDTLLLAAEAASRQGGCWTPDSFGHAWAFFALCDVGEIIGGKAASCAADNAIDAIDAALAVDTRQQRRRRQRRA